MDTSCLDRLMFEWLSESDKYPTWGLPARKGGDSSHTAGVNREEGGDDVKSSRPLRPGPHTCYNGRYSEQPPSDRERIYKTGHSSDWSLQLDSMKLESLVIGYQP
ncbi:hypothetical protein GWI33_012212 [Rhynchophorus ferrugineus]|uniref:Uncharacterized protein n=1 Tax=Rhynchophorus ferrugineus TaxID=354439 RepID=A0A834MB14_RHYFE|nr:hypothetical protein GWI33_012212 [Rhynchophorus ferrugineus]